MPCLPARQSWPDQCRSRVLACPGALQVNTYTHTHIFHYTVCVRQITKTRTARTTTSGQWTMAMWMDLTDTDLCTRQSHLWPRWATSRIDRCIVRPGTPSGSKPSRTARWRNRTRWWPPLQGKKSQEIVRLWVFVFMHIHTRLDARIHSYGAEYLGIFFIVFHGTTCLQVAFTAVETGQLSCSPSPSRGKEC